MPVLDRFRRRRGDVSGASPAPNSNAPEQKLSMPPPAAVPTTDLPAGHFNLHSKPKTVAYISEDSVVNLQIRVVLRNVPPDITLMSKPKTMKALELALKDRQNRRQHQTDALNQAMVVPTPENSGLGASTAFSSSHQQPTRSLASNLICKTFSWQQKVFGPNDFLHLLHPQRQSLFSFRSVDSQLLQRTIPEAVQRQRDSDLQQLLQQLHPNLTLEQTARTVIASMSTPDIASQFSVNNSSSASSTSSVPPSLPATLSTPNSHGVMLFTAPADESIRDPLLPTLAASESFSIGVSLCPRNREAPNIPDTLSSSYWTQWRERLLCTVNATSSGIEMTVCV